MSRPIRIEFPDALYHVTARGDRREDIFEDDADRQIFLSTLEKVITQFNWLCHAWCLMDNHYHLMIQTPDGIYPKACANSTVSARSPAIVATGVLVICFKDASKLFL